MKRNNILNYLSDLFVNFTIVLGVFAVIVNILVMILKIIKC